MAPSCLTHTPIWLVCICQLNDWAPSPGSLIVYGDVTEVAFDIYTLFIVNDSQYLYVRLLSTGIHTIALIPLSMFHGLLQPHALHDSCEFLPVTLSGLEVPDSLSEGLQMSM